MQEENELAGSESETLINADSPTVESPGTSAIVKQKTMKSKLGLGGMQKSQIVGKPTIVRKAAQTREPELAFDLYTSIVQEADDGKDLI